MRRVIAAAEPHKLLRVCNQRSNHHGTENSSRNSDSIAAIVIAMIVCEGRSRYRRSEHANDRVPAYAGTMDFRVSF
jgi:hypothetical protein